MSTTKRHTAKTRRHSIVRALRHYLVLLLVLVLGLGVITVGRVSGAVLGYATNVSHGGLLAATNQSRASNGLGGLNLNAQLNQAAQAKANDMVARNYWSHDTPDGQAPWVFVNNAGYKYRAIAENLAYGFSTSDEVIAGWMNSSGHRTNMLGDYIDVGFGFANSDNYQNNGPQTVVVAFYGRQFQSTSPPPPPAAQPVAPPAAQPPAASPAPSTSSPPTSITPVEQAPAAPAPEQPAAPTPEASPAPAPEVAREQAASSGQTAAVTTSPRAVSWLQARAGMLAPIILIIGLIGVAGSVLIFLYRHSAAWHRVIVQGEHFVMRHKTIDVLTIIGIVLIVLAVQIVGIVR